MFELFQVGTLLLVAAAWAFALAHTAEAPGKRRLDRDTYFAVQRIYYPGFTIGGISEPAAIVALAALLLMTGTDAPAFTGILVALVAAIAGQTLYWLATHPVNKRWIAEQPLGEAAGTFFGAGREAKEASWTSDRDRWDTSHILRFLLFTAALIALAFALIE